MPHTLKYCPSCGAQTFLSGDFKPWECKSCGFVFFQNTASAAGAFISDASGRLLLVRRSKEPSKGKLGIPGGFLDKGETAESGLMREVLEEVNLHIKDLEYLCSCPNEYHYKGLCYQTIDLYFKASVKNLEEAHALDEVDAIEWIDPMTVADEDLAFPSLANALSQWKAKSK